VLEPGTRPARALPYELHVHGEVDASQGGVRLFCTNSGKAGAFFEVRSGDGQTGPWTYTGGAGVDCAVYGQIDALGG